MPVVILLLAIAGTLPVVILLVALPLAALANILNMLTPLVLSTVFDRMFTSWIQLRLKRIQLLLILYESYDKEEFQP
jgi:mannose/fructose/N-acetylgalactosamine-specific phosphotransferase system component IIC